MYLQLRILISLLLAALVATICNSSWAQQSAPRPGVQSDSGTLYLEHCAGCHGANRAGRAGAELFVTLMRERGELSIKQTLHFGTSTGMPNWGTSDVLSEDQLEQLADYLLQSPNEQSLKSQELPSSIRFDMTQVRSSWQETLSKRQRPKRSQAVVSPDDLFVSLLHDTASILFIDGRSKNVLNRELTGVAPHVLERSPDGRYLYVLGRGGELTMLDLFAPRPTTVASIRVGYEARAMAITGRGKTARLLVAAQTPGQLLSLDPTTLEPHYRIDIPGTTHTAELELGDTGTRAIQIVGTPKRRGNFVLVTDSPGAIYVGHLKATGEPVLVPAIPTASSLGPGVLIGHGKHALALFPGQQNTVAALQPFAKAQAPASPQEITLPDFNTAGAGAFFTTPDGQHYWLTGSVFTAGAVVLAHSGKRDSHWRLHKQLDFTAAGSLFVATHPASDNLWLDSPASLPPESGGSVRVLSKIQLLSAGEIRDRSLRPEVLPIAQWIDLDGDRVRIVHPQFNAAGDEIWLTAWNRQDRRSAVVVLDERTRKIKAVIEDTNLVTPIRTYSLAGLRRIASGGTQ